MFSTIVSSTRMSAARSSVARARLFHASPVASKTVTEKVSEVADKVNSIILFRCSIYLDYSLDRSIRRLERVLPRPLILAKVRWNLLRRLLASETLDTALETAPYSHVGAAREKTKEKSHEAAQKTKEAANVAGQKTNQVFEYPRLRLCTSSSSSSPRQLQEHVRELKTSSKR